MTKRLILLATLFAITLSLSAQRNMQVWEGNTYSEFLTNSIDSVTFLLYPEGTLRECETQHDTIIKIDLVHDTIISISHDTVINTIKDTIFVNRCDSIDNIATVLTTAVTHSTYNSLVLGGKVFFSNNHAIIERGICYATHTQPTPSDKVVKAGNGIGSFTATIVGVAENTCYYLRAYAINPWGTYYGNEITYITPQKTTVDTLSEGACSGMFTVGYDKQVVFSKGNLQYQASTDTWRFAEQQYDYIGKDNENASATYDGWIDLFGWGTSGFDNTAKDPSAINYQPWATSTIEIKRILIDSVLDCSMQQITGSCVMRYVYMDGSHNTYGYGPSTDWGTNLTGRNANYDWGVYNAISNGGNQAGIWRTLTYEEWDYLLNSRKNAKYLWSEGTVNGVRGVIFLPDNFVKPSSISWIPNGTKVYTSSEWKTLEDVGAIFLPAAGKRADGRCHYYDITDTNMQGAYWSTTGSYSYGQPNPEKAQCIHFGNGSWCSSEVNDDAQYRDWSLSVRLVQDVK